MKNGVNPNENFGNELDNTKAAKQGIWHPGQQANRSEDAMKQYGQSFAGGAGQMGANATGRPNLGLPAGLQTYISRYGK